MSNIIKGIKSSICMLPAYGEKGDEWIREELGNEQCVLDKEIDVAERLVAKFKEEYLDMYPVIVDHDNDAGISIASYSLPVFAERSVDIVYTEDFIRRGIIKAFKKCEKHLVPAIITVKVYREDKFLNSYGQFGITVIFDKEKVEKLKEKEQYFTGTVLLLCTAPTPSMFSVCKSTGESCDVEYYKDVVEQLSKREQMEVMAEIALAKMLINGFKKKYYNPLNDGWTHITYDKKAKLFVVACEVNMRIYEEKMTVIPECTKDYLTGSVKNIIAAKEPKLIGSIYTIVVERVDQLYTQRQIPGNINEWFRISIYLKSKDVKKLLKD